MMRWVIPFLLWAGSVAAQDFSGLARVNPDTARIANTADGVQVTLELSQIVPYRVFTLAAPERLVLDFREVDWTGVAANELDQSARVDAVNFGTLRPGWSRMVLELSGPFAVNAVAGAVDDKTGVARLSVSLVPVSAEEFVERSGPPVSTGWDDLLTEPVVGPQPPADGETVVVIDPGHGGIDPGAEHGGQREADLMLTLGIEVAEALNRTDGVTAILTRDRDQFVPLTKRMTIARQNNADLLISLHADALAEGRARGGSVYTLSEDAANGAAQRMAERHERGDLIAGLDLSEQDDRVAGVLMDLARAKTGPQGQRFAGALIGALQERDVRLHRNALRQGPLAVLNAADFASVLFEVGYLSSDRDRAILLDRDQRAVIVDAIVAAVLDWSLAEAVRE